MAPAGAGVSASAGKEDGGRISDSTAVDADCDSTPDPDTSTVPDIVDGAAAGAESDATGGFMAMVPVSATPWSV